MMHHCKLFVQILSFFFITQVGGVKPNTIDSIPEDLNSTDEEMKELVERIKIEPTYKDQAEQEVPPPPPVVATPSDPSAPLEPITASTTPNKTNNNPEAEQKVPPPSVATPSDPSATLEPALTFGATPSDPSAPPRYEDEGRGEGEFIEGEPSAKDLEKRLSLEVPKGPSFEGRDEGESKGKPSAKDSERQRLISEPRTDKQIFGERSEYLASGDEAEENDAKDDEKNPLFPPGVKFLSSNQRSEYPASGGHNKNNSAQQPHSGGNKTGERSEYPASGGKLRGGRNGCCRHGCNRYCYCDAQCNGCVNCSEDCGLLIGDCMDHLGITRERCCELYQSVECGPCCECGGGAEGCQGCGDGGCQGCDCNDCDCSGCM